MDNYIILNNGLIKQKIINKIEYNYKYSNQYNNYGEKSNYLSYLRLGILLGNINFIPKTILDIGYGNCNFLDASKNIIKKCYWFDISDYPVSEGIIRVDNIFNKHYDIVCFFDSLEHFDDIYVIKDLKCDYIFISVPFCHFFSSEWFLNWYHRRENEHLWHFNKESLCNFFNELGYDNIYLGNFEDTVRKNENVLPHENILSGIFKKKY